MQTTWVTKFAIVALVGGMWFVNYSLGVTPATAVPPVTEDPHAGVTQNREKNLPNTSRFTVLTDFGGAAVRDNNTGLVWEQEPDTIARFGLDWGRARMYCVNKNVGGRVGWRLPSEVELTSLQDRSLPAPFVPASVFTGVQRAFYWSASGLVIPFNNGLILGYESISNIVWCVRGGMNADAY